MGDKKEFVCLENTKFIGNHQESTCLETGFWSNPLPQCLAPCIIPQVEHSTGIYVVPADSNKLNLTNVTLEMIRPGLQVSHGSYLEILCEKNHELDEQIDDENVIQAPVCLNATWSYTPKCKPASCRSTPPSPKNGRVRIASIEHGSEGYIHCLDGFRLKGSNVTYCAKGQWSSIDSVCAEVYCGFPGTIEHGRILLVGLTGMYDYKNYIRRISNNRQIAYECEVGFRMNDGAPSGATCLEGQWKPEGLPSCIRGM